MSHHNPCPRCGQLRIVDKVWVEEIASAGGVSKLTHTLMVCPDPKCQEKVEQELATATEKRANLLEAKNAREQERLKQLANKKASQAK